MFLNSKFKFLSVQNHIKFIFVVSIGRSIPVQMWQKHHLQLIVRTQLPNPQRDQKQFFACQLQAQ
jgi:hypothetical protein